MQPLSLLNSFYSHSFCRKTPSPMIRTPRHSTGSQRRDVPLFSDWASLQTLDRFVVCVIEGGRRKKADY